MKTTIPPRASNQRLTPDEALALLRDAPLLELGRRAFEYKRALHGDRVTYVRNRHINPTNLCVFDCKFCDYAAKPGDPHAYMLSEEEILESVASPEISEVHMVGGLWPKWGFSRSMDLVRRIRALRPDLFIKAFTAVEVAYFAQSARSSTEAVIRAMIEAGVDLMPGGGAEVLSDRIHAELYPKKIGPDAWLAIHGLAHALGLPSNATLLFGHIETDEEIVSHLFKLRALQDQTQGFVSFIPLLYQPGSTGLVPHLASAPRCLRVIALARLVLDNIPHIKAYWPSLQVETAVSALNFGADDLDGTLGKERIMQLAGTQSPEQASVALMRRMVADAGQVPFERNGRFARVDALAEVGA